MELYEFKAKLKSGSIAGTYIFCGEEDYLKRFYLGTLRDKIGGDPAFYTFNRAVYDGGEVDFGAITDDIMSPPMFEEYKLIEWRYPDFEKMKESELSSLEAVIDNANRSGYTVLVFLAADGAVDLGTPKKPGKLIKRLGDKAHILDFERSTDAQLLSWLKKHFDAEGIAVTAEVLRTLIFRTGHSMTVLNEEVTKLSMLAKSRGKSEITAEDVVDTASSTVECDTFALQNAILDRNKRAAFLALEEMKAEKADPIMILGMMAKSYTELAAVSMFLKDGVGESAIITATKLNPYRLKLYVAAARRYKSDEIAAIVAELTKVDSGSKFGGVSGYTAIELFISKFL